MYDMYHWHRIDAGTDDSVRRTGSAPASTAYRSAASRHANGTAPANGGGVAPGTCAANGGAANGGGTAAGPAVQAVQAALDRRDNGGDLAAARGE